MQIDLKTKIDILWAKNAGEINYANKWTWKKVDIIASDKTTVSLKKSTDANL